ncbi:Alcohol dehydrogenase [Gryllus bimaculatus]|nr:Alcohol dehydrogenase [Gryllus bimaculatus]
MLRRFFPEVKKLSSNMSCQAGNVKLKGKVAVVTASTDGIGLAIARRLAQDGASVVISSRKENNVQRAVKDLQSEGLTVSGIVCHVGKASDRQKLLECASSKYGGIDILVSNAAVNPTVGHVLECEESSWDKIFEINVKAAYMLSKEVLPFLRQRGGGSITYISSIAGFQPFDVLGAYSVSKTALLGLTKAASQGLAEENIRVNCVAPGIVETRFAAAVKNEYINEAQTNVHAILDQLKGPDIDAAKYINGITNEPASQQAVSTEELILHEQESAREAAVSKIPMGRLAQPHEIAGIVSFLCSNDASYITGETIVVSGGMSSRL